MSSLVLSETLIRRIEKVAQEKNLTPAELLERMLDAEAQHAPPAVETSTEEAPPGSLAALAQAAIRANIHSGHPVDTSSRVNEIMRTEFADYVRRNMDRDERRDENDSAS
ncbi:MAG: hypothetical protein K8L91_28040 [Anaerolineae bacterium]|nr:hypothetical protein [Anaerolineae bacterium]